MCVTYYTWSNTCDVYAFKNFEGVYITKVSFRRSKDNYLPHDGEEFSDPTLPQFLERLEYLRHVGYIIEEKDISSNESELDDD